ncbi:MAG: hypothetical protein IJ899_13445 [Blautia sp.]|nr:hypothetical protein [Blautia sp.]
MTSIYDIREELPKLSSMQDDVLYHMNSTDSIETTAKEYAARILDTDWDSLAKFISRNQDRMDEALSEYGGVDSIAGLAQLAERDLYIENILDGKLEIAVSFALDYLEDNGITEVDDLFLETFETHLPSGYEQLPASQITEIGRLAAQGQPALDDKVKEADGILASRAAAEENTKAEEQLI